MTYIQQKIIPSIANLIGTDRDFVDDEVIACAVWLGVIAVHQLSGSCERRTTTGSGVHGQIKKNTACLPLAVGFAN